MKEFSIPLISEYQRPVIELYKLPALIDTGAVIPVFSIFLTILEKFFDTKIILNGKLFPQIDGILLQDIDIELESFYIF